MTHSQVFYVGVALTGVVVFVVFQFHTLRFAYEKIAVTLGTTPERAFYYGTRHFDAHRPAEYDIDRAEFFFNKALTLDTSLPMVRHELARIAFLRGSFSRALLLIDEEMRMSAKPSPTSYYVRALIKGYAQDYAGAAQDYETYFTVTPANWGSINDYSWVLLKANLPEGALSALEWGLKEWPENPWLLNSMVVTLYELGRFAEAREVAARAVREVATVTSRDWLDAYPGNDPLIAEAGLIAFKEAVHINQKRVGVRASPRDASHE